MISIFTILADSIFSQATLPVFRTAWTGTTPANWIDFNTGSYTTSFACSGNNMGKLDNDNDYYEVYFTVVDQTVIEVNYTIRGANFSGGDFDVEFSHDGTNSTNLASYGSLSGSCTGFQNTYTASGTNSYVRFYYTDKVTGNVGLDDVDIDQQIPAPVTLAYFSAKPITNKSIELNWTTVSEENNDFFAIEHSVDGREFKEIDRIGGAGTTADLQHYEFVHKNVRKGNNYYRLRQMDYDGTFSLSPIKVVLLEDLSEITVRPTLAHSEIEVSLNEIKGTGIISIVNLMGQVVKAFPFSSDNKKITLNVNNLEPGHYILRINTKAGTKTSRFVKL